MKTIDWRGEICRLLEIAPESSNVDIFGAMDVAMKKLKEFEQLKSRAFADQGPPTWQIVHTVHCHKSPNERRLYLDQPSIFESGPYNVHLRGRRILSNLDLYLERNKDIIFIVYRNYECCKNMSALEYQLYADMEIDVKASDLLLTESIVLVSPDLKAALGKLADVALCSIPYPKADKEDHAPITHPYLWWYHCREELKQAKPMLPLQQHVDVLQDYIQERMSNEWTTVGQLLSQSRITRQYMDYLFVRVDGEPIRIHF